MQADIRSVPIVMEDVQIIGETFTPEEPLEYLGIKDIMMLTNKIPINIYFLIL